MKDKYWTIEMINQFGSFATATVRAAGIRSAIRNALRVTPREYNAGPWTVTFWKEIVDATPKNS